MDRSSISNKFPLGSKLPKFDLPNVDGKILGSNYLSDATLALVVFTCNHCPYVKGSEEMLIATANKFSGAGLKVVSISSNDALAYPEDAPDKMREKSVAMNLPYPYLYDKTQQVARSFDAACTPECYLFNNKQELIYHGAINDNPKDPSNAKTNYLANAISQSLEGKVPEPAFVNPLGCSIKWSRGNA